MEGEMPIFCISLPRPGPRLRAVIVIVIYLVAFRIAPGDSIPLSLGGILGAAGGLAIGSADAASAGSKPERA
jgi:hypothetical protein